MHIYSTGWSTAPVGGKESFLQYIYEDAFPGSHEIDGCWRRFRCEECPEIFEVLSCKKARRSDKRNYATGFCFPKGNIRKETVQIRVSVKAPLVMRSDGGIETSPSIGWVAND